MNPCLKMGNKKVQAPDFPRINPVYLPAPLEPIPQPILLLDFTIGIHENSYL